MARLAVGGVTKNLDGKLAGSGLDNRPGAWLCGAREVALACAGALEPASYCVPVTRAAAPRAWKTGTGEYLAEKLTQTPDLSCCLCLRHTTGRSPQQSPGDVLFNPDVTMATWAPGKPETKIS